MDELFLKLKKMPDYKAYKKKCRIRALVALVIIAIFGAIVLETADFRKINA